MTQITGFHTHVYDDAVSRDITVKVLTETDMVLGVRLGWWHDEPVDSQPIGEVRNVQITAIALSSWVSLN